ncbi:hypothetical protein CYMTET_32102, partial [Cymbomonas tetramitiformis]
VKGDEGGRGCVKNKPLVMPRGEILAGASTEEGTWNAFTDRSTDNGRTWQRAENVDVVDEAGVIQPTLWASPGDDQQVHMLIRSDAGAIYRADSADGGATWGPAKRTKLPNNNSGLDVVLLGKTLVLAYNPTAGNWVSRYPLRLSVSDDNGQNWTKHFDIETSPGEYSYPAIVPWHTNLGFHLTYTWNRERIVYASMSLEELLTRATPAPLSAQVAGA